MTVQAVWMVHRNKECWQLAHHVMMISDLLRLLEQSEMMQGPEIRRPLDGLEDTLRQAYMLVTSCQKSSITHRFFRAGSQAQQFRDIRDQIDSYLRTYPLIRHIDTRHFIQGLYNRVHCSDTEPQASEGVLGSLKGCWGHLRSFIPWFSASEGVLGSLKVIHTLVLGGLCNGLRERHQQLNQFVDLLVMGKTGVLPNGVDVAIKIRHREHLSGRLDFENEVQIVPKLQHANIVKLLGCCIEGDNRVLVYEYMPNGSLHYRILGVVIVAELRAGVSIAWPIWFRIIEGIAQGAVYLHQHSRVRVIHGDLKSSNIVLDCDMTPRITDFWMAEILSSHEDEKESDMIAGTLGFIDPESLRAHIISIKSDVYTFGVIVLEIITAQLPLTPYFPDRQLLVVYAWEL